MARCVKRKLDGHWQSLLHVGSSGWYELTSIRLWNAELAIVSPSTWGKNCEKCDKMKYNSWPSCCPHENAKKKQKTDPGVFGAHNFYWVEGELLIVVHLEISQRSSKHSKNKFNSKKDLRVYLGLFARSSPQDKEREQWIFRSDILIQDFDPQPTHI